MLWTNWNYYTEADWPSTPRPTLSHNWKLNCPTGRYHTDKKPFQSILENLELATELPGNENDKSNGKWQDCHGEESKTIDPWWCTYSVSAIFADSDSRFEAFWPILGWRSYLQPTAERPERLDLSPINRNPYEGLFTAFKRHSKTSSMRRYIIWF